jgi:hypothetical protein
VVLVLVIDLHGARPEDGTGRFEDSTRGRAAIFAIYVTPSKIGCHLRSSVAIFGKGRFRSTIGPRAMPTFSTSSA